MFCFNCAPYRMNHISSAGWQPLNRNECPFIVGIYHCLKRGGEIESRDLVNVFSPWPSQKVHCTRTFNLNLSLFALCEHVFFLMQCVRALDFCMST